MTDYIDKHEAYTLLKDLEAAYIYPPVKEAYATAARRIDQMKAADVQPVKHGEWKKKFLSDTICCSECKVTWSSSFKDMLNGFNYCPKCGARMKQEG